MRDIVIDSSVAVKWFLNELNSAEALAILNDFQLNNLSLLAPDFIYAELGNVMWQRVKRKALAVVDAQDFVDKIIKIKFTLTSTATLLGDAYQLAVAHERSVYDSLYLALSIREQCQLVTADEKLINAIGVKFPNIILLANWS
jgi:predicted nucleic acid-binding protein